MQTSTLGGVLRAWRDRSRATTNAHSRRVPGLRREELAALAGISVDYVVRLEQGRAAHPSPQVVASLARALRLTRGERTHLHQLAGVVEPRVAKMPTDLTPGLMRMLERLQGTPVAVFTAGWTQLQCNAPWEALHGAAWRSPGRAKNLVWRLFTSAGPNVLRSPEEQAAFAAVMVADLRGAAGRYPRDAELQSLINDLHEQSPTFCRLWRAAHVEPHHSKRKTLDTRLGPVTLDCDVLSTENDLRVVIYTAAPDSTDARRLKRLLLSAPSQ